MWHLPCHWLWHWIFGGINIRLACMAISGPIAFVFNSEKQYRPCVTTLEFYTVVRVGGRSGQHEQIFQVYRAPPGKISDVHTPPRDIKRSDKEVWTHVIAIKYDRSTWIVMRWVYLFRCRARKWRVLVARVPAPEQQRIVYRQNQRDRIRQNLSALGLRYSTSTHNVTNGFSRGQLDGCGKLLSQSISGCHYLVLYYRSWNSLWVLSDTLLL